MKKHPPTSTQGMALVLALFFMSIAVLALTALSARLLGQRLLVDQYQDYIATFQGLETAVIMSKAEKESGDDGAVGLEDWEPEYDESNELKLPDFDAEDVEPASLASMPEVQFVSYTVSWANDGRDSNGDGVVDSTAENNMYSVHAAAKKGNSTRRVEVVLEGDDVNVWRNAIFAGVGQAGGLINGNVSIHGSVHLLGDNLLTGGAAIAALDMSGTSLIHNNYAGMPAALAARIPALPQASYGEETISTLEANMRVRNGLVSLSGNSEIGEPNIVGNAIKETMDGTYVDDGWTGNAVTPDGDRGDPTSVFSDNGWDEGYDLGTKVSLPMLTDDWRDPLDGHKEFDASTGTWFTHQDYFNQVLLADPTDPNDGVYNGNITLNAKGSKFFWNATTGVVMNGSLPAAMPPENEDYIYFDPTADVMQINGQIRINGNLAFTGQGNDRTVNYSGRGAVLVYGDVTIDANLLTCNGLNKNDTADSFPVNNILGIMASQNMTVGSSSQLSIMGAFYAQQQITSAKQTNVLGTFVSNYFDMGTNVPSIFQVPSLADNLPLGMIGNYPVLALDQVAWREIGI